MIMTIVMITSGYKINISFMWIKVNHKDNIP